MSPSTNHKKIYSVLILCIGVIGSVWLFSQTPNISEIKNAGNNTPDISVRPYINLEEEKNDSWKKILLNIDQKNQGVTDLTKTNKSTFDETLLTAQLSRDFMSQYLLLKRGGRDLTKEDIDNIVTNITSSPQYIESSGPVYISKNLKITSQTDKDTVQKYKSEITAVLTKRTKEIKYNPITIVTTAITEKNELVLKQLDPIILTTKSTVTDLLNIEVPADAVGVHLDLLNGSSNILNDLEGMRVSFTDPIRSFVVLNQYSTHITNIQTALTKMSSYFTKKLGSI